MAPVTVSRAGDDTPAIGGLFNGLSFFLVQRVPSRSDFVSRIQVNGGRVVKLEAQADHVIADHARKDAPPGSISYRFIERAIKDGELPDPADHTAGPPLGTVRDVGSAVPGKSTRTPFTREDDMELWQWVQSCKANGASVKGNAIYKQLEARNPRHTSQSWRDRYIKKLMDNPPSGVPHAVFNDDDIGALLENAKDIEHVDKEMIEDAWEAWAQVRPGHTAIAWRKLYEEKVRPMYLQQREEKKTAKQNERAAKEKSNSEADRARKARQSTPPTLQSNDSAETARSHGTAKETEVHDPQKRKRRTPSANASPMYSRKKQKAGSRDLVMDDVDENLGITKSQLPTATSNEVIEIPSEDESEGPEKAVDEFQSSDSSRSAQERLVRDRSPEIGDKNVGNQGHWPPALNPITPDSSHEVDQQMGQELLDDANSHKPDQRVGTPLDPEDADVYRANTHHIRHRSLEGAEAVTRNADEAQLPASEANRAADEQMRRESLGGYHVTNNARQPGTPAEVSSPLGTHDLLISSHLVGDGEVEEGTPVPDVLDDDGAGLALTEANLASQQSQHQQQLVRGVDLPEDDEMQDQGDYLKYLQGLTGRTVDAHAEPTAQEDRKASREQVIELREEDEESLPSIPLLDQTQHRHHPSLQPARDEGQSEAQRVPFMQEARHTQSDLYKPSDDTGAADLLNLPLSTQQDVDEVLESNLEWPSSPHQRKKTQRPPSRFQTDDTQFEFSEVQNAAAYARQGEREESSNRSLQSQAVLNSNVQEPHQKPAEPTSLLRPEASALRNFPQQNGSNVESDQVDEDMSPSNDQDEGDVFDLIVPEPEGGWESLSAPESGGEASANEAASKSVRVPTASQYDGALDESSAPPSPSSQSSEAPSAPPMKSNPSAGKVLYTQDILDAETQQPDLDMPLPSDSDEDFEEDYPWSSSPTVKAVKPVSHLPPQQQQQHTARPVQGHQTQSTPQRQLPRLQQLHDDDDIGTYMTTLEIRHGYSEGSIVAALKMTSMRPELAELVLLEQRAGKGVPTDVPGIWSEGEDGTAEGRDAGRLKGLGQKHGWEEVEARLRFLKDWREAE